MQKNQPTYKQGNLEIQRQFRETISHFTSGVAVITTTGNDGPTGLTTTSVCSVSLDPLLLLVCFDQKSRTLTAVKETKRFAVNILCHDQTKIATMFASKQKGSEKLSAVAHTTQYGVPVLDHALAKLVCDVTNLQQAGDHIVTFATPIAMHVTTEEVQPLLWFQGKFNELNHTKPHSGHSLEEL